MNFSSTLIQRCRGDYIPYFKTPIFCCSLFSEKYLNHQVRINKMVKEHTVDYHPTPSELILRIHLIIFLWTPKGFISPEYFLSFSSNLYIPPMLRKGIYGIKITGNNICESKNWICSFWLMLSNKTPPRGSYYPPQAEGNYPFFPNCIFCKSFFNFFSSRKGG